MLEGRDEIRDMFSEKLNSFESEVRPEVWSKISSQIATTAATSTAISVALKVVIASTVAASIAGAVYLYNKDSKDSDNKKQDPIQTNTEISQNDIQAPEVKTKENEIQVSNKLATPISVPYVKEDNKISPVIKETESNLGVNNSQKIEALDLDKTSINTDVRTENKEIREDKKLIEKNPDPVVEEFERKEEMKADYVLNLPNIFTPNGDGSNDILSIKSENLSDLNVVILDQNNKVIFSTDNPDFRWDGTTLSGDSVPSGNYVYYVTGKDTNGKVISKYSLLTITR